MLSVLHINSAILFLFLQKREMTDRADHHVSDNPHRFFIFPASTVSLLYSDYQRIDS